VQRNYADTNLGCRRRLSSGLDWAFSLVDEAIILEDDTLPHPDFFKFCMEMLDRYRADDRVGHIGGVNFHPEIRRSSYSYFFSRYASVWGWATWRRAWHRYDVDMRLWPELRAGHWHRDVFATSDEIRYFERNWDDLAAGRIDTWDGQWLFTCMTQGMACIRPATNLVTNLGFGADADATHTTFDHRVGNMLATPLEFPLKHPPFLIPDREADVRLAEMVFQPAGKVSVSWIRTRLLNRHWYGGMVRRIPGVRRVWVAFRGKARRP
jgi:hypothetical protein